MKWSGKRNAACRCDQRAEGIGLHSTDPSGDAQRKASFSEWHSIPFEEIYFRRDYLLYIHRVVLDGVKRKNVIHSYKNLCRC